MASANDTASGLLRAATLAGLLAVIAGNGDVRCAPAPVECVDGDCACDGWPEQVIITEILPRTATGWACAQWFELYNPGPLDIDLDGWSFEDPVTGARLSLPVYPGYAQVLRRGAYRHVSQSFIGIWCGYRDPGLVGYPYYQEEGDFSLGLYEGGIVLRDPAGRVVDAVVWDRSWGFEPGRSLELVDPRLDNALRANWRTATRWYGWEAYDLDLYGTPNLPPEAGAGRDLDGPCDDANPCTVDYCLEQVGCAHALVKDPCDDGDPCTEEDRCVRTLVGALCVGLEGHACDDGCSEGEACDDGDPCTIADSCAGGRCRGVVPPRYPQCDDPNQLGPIGEGVCLPALGGFAYPIESWGRGGDLFLDIQCRDDSDCAEYVAPTSCGAVRCWPPIERCMLLPY